MTTDLSIYQCDEIVKQIEAIAAANEGEIPEDQLALLVQAQTTEMTKLGGLCGFIKYVEHRIDACKQEETRIAAIRKTAEKRLAAIEAYLVPFVSQYRAEKGRPLDVGTFTLSTRKSESVEIDDVNFNSEENRKNWCTEKVSYTPKKTEIKQALKAGQEIHGAKIANHENLQIR